MSDFLKDINAVIFAIILLLLVGPAMLFGFGIVLLYIIQEGLRMAFDPLFTRFVVTFLLVLLLIIVVLLFVGTYAYSKSMANRPISTPAIINLGGEVRKMDAVMEDKTYLPLSPSEVRTKIELPD